MINYWKPWKRYAYDYIWRTWATTQEQSCFNLKLNFSSTCHLSSSWKNQDEVSIFPEFLPQNTNPFCWSAWEEKEWLCWGVMSYVSWMMWVGLHQKRGRRVMWDWGGVGVNVFSSVTREEEVERITMMILWSFLLNMPFQRNEPSNLIFITVSSVLGLKLPPPSLTLLINYTHPLSPSLSPSLSLSYLLLLPSSHLK